MSLISDLYASYLEHQVRCDRLRRMCVGVVLIITVTGSFAYLA
jgi:hypothetical protein